MLPSRLYRNLGIPPPLRSLITPHSSLPPTLKVQLRFRLGVVSTPSSRLTPLAPRFHSTSTTTATTSPSSNHDTKTTSSEANTSSTPTVTSQDLPEKMEPRLSMTFTCTVTDCNTRSTHQFSKRSYERGIVLIQCPGCENRHLIADHLGWFKESTEDGKLRTVEDLLRARGETVRRGKIDAGGVVEYVE